MGSRYSRRLRIIVVSSITSQIRYLSLYSKVLYLSFSPILPLLTAPVKLLVKLTSATLSFKPDVILVYPCYPLGLFSAIAAHFSRKAHVTFVYGNDVRKHTRIGKTMVYLTLRLSHGVICDSRSIAMFVKRSVDRNVVTIPMGIDTLRMTSIQPKKKPNTIVSVVNFGLAYEKGVDLLVRATKAIPKARLVLIGDGSQRSAMMSIAKKLDLDDRVTFTGFIARQELWIRLKQASLFAMPIRASFIEGTNRAVLEAMYCSLPVVVTRTGGLPDVVRNGVNGLVVWPGSLIELVEAIKAVLSDPRLREEMGRNNRLEAGKYLAEDPAARRYGYLRYVACHWDTYAFE